MEQELPESMQLPTKSRDEELIESIRQLTAINERMYRRMGLGYALFHGLLAAIGSTVGLAIILAAIAYILQWLSIFDNFQSTLGPFLGSKTP